MNRFPVPQNPLPSGQMSGRAGRPDAVRRLNEILAQPRRRGGWVRRHRGLIGSAVGVTAVVGTFVALLVVSKPSDDVRPATPAAWGLRIVTRVVPGPSSTRSGEALTRRAIEVLTARAAAMGIAGFEARASGSDRVELIVPAAERVIDVQGLLVPADFRIFDATAALRAEANGIGELVDRIPGVPSKDPGSFVLATKTTPRTYLGVGPQLAPELFTTGFLPPGSDQANLEPIGLPRGWTILIENGQLTPTSRPRPGLALLVGNPIVASDELLGAHKLDPQHVALKLANAVADRVRATGSGALIGVTTESLVEHVGRIEDAPGLATDEVALTVAIDGTAGDLAKRLAGGGLDAGFVTVSSAEFGERPSRTGRPVGPNDAQLVAKEGIDRDSVLEALAADTPSDGRWQLITGIRTVERTEQMMTVVDGRIVGRIFECPLPPTSPVLQMCTTQAGAQNAIAVIGRTRHDATALDLRYPGGNVVPAWAENGWFLAIAPIALGNPEAFVAKNAAGEVIAEVAASDQPIGDITKIVQAPPPPGP